MTSLASPSPAASSFPANPAAPPYPNDLEWITAYLTIHSLTVPSRRYSFVLWIAVVFIFLVFAILHWTGSRGGIFGAYWTKWFLRRRTWRKKHSLAVASQKGQPHRQPLSLPSNAQLLCLAVLFLASLALAFVGPDYIAPSEKVWQVSSSNSNKLERPTSSYSTSTFLPLQPQYTISKSWWSSSARTGQIAFALFPLCVLFALKSPPFAVFAIPFMIQLFFDKLAWLHRWSGRLIWLLTAVHVALWSVQLATDIRTQTGKVAYTYTWLYMPFIYGWIAFGFLTFLIILSIHPIRRRYYEVFYFLHVLLVPLTLVFAAFHHPTVWWWCWAALALWGGERLWRATWWIYSNGFLGGMISPSAQRLAATPYTMRSPQDTWELNHLRSLHPEPLQSPLDKHDIRPSSPLSSYYQSHDPSANNKGYPPASLVISPTSTFTQHDRSPPSTPPLPSYIPPPGFAHAELLPGRTIRLRLVTPGFNSWAPGQHFLINVPFVSRITSHPFTSASVCDEQAQTDEGRMIVMLIRAKGGWTQDLWNAITHLTEQGLRNPLNEEPPENFTSRMSHGVLLRAYVDGPFGSSIRARWGDHSTVLIVAGGSGVSFGLSILQYVCLCLSGRDGRYLGSRPGGWGKKRLLTTRVRFIWLAREYSHIQWCASILRRCLSTLPPSAIQVDIFITNFQPMVKAPDVPTLRRPPPSLYPSGSLNTIDLAPPLPSFARGGTSPSHGRADSVESVDSHDSSADSDVDLSYYTGEFMDDEIESGDIGLAHRNNMLELTNFDGDDDTALPGEDVLNKKVKKEGKLRRAQSRRLDRMSVRLVPATKPDERGDLGAHEPSWSRKPKRLQDRLSVVSSHSTDRLLPISPLSDRTSVISPIDSPSPVAVLNDHGAWRKGNALISPISTAESSRTLLTPTMSRGETLPMSSTSDDKAGFANSHGGISQPRDRNSDGLGRLKVNEQEVVDAGVVAEHARLGKPKLDRIIADEVEHSKGSVIVACCGPTSLNAMVRKIIAGQIDPGRIRRGDMRGSIVLVSEEFEY